MTFKTCLLAAAAILTIGVASASAQPIYPPPGNDPDGYYSRTDQSGYYDRNGQYRRIRSDNNYRDNGPPPPPPGLTDRRRQSITSRVAMKIIAIAATRRPARSSAPLRAA